MMKSFDFKARNKVVLYGAQSVGKSSLVHRERSGAFEPYSVPTLGAAFIQRTKEVDGVSISVEIWDTAGSERFNTILPIYLRHAELILICFHDIERKLLDRFLNECRLESPTARIFFVATKMDEKKRPAALDYAKQKAEQENIPMFYTSAVTGLGVENLFNAIFSHFARRPQPKPQTDIIDINQDQSRCCVIL